jgi:hypothetical protein
MQLPGCIAITQQPKRTYGIITGAGQKSTLRVCLVEDSAVVCDSLLVLQHIPGAFQITGRIKKKSPRALFID